jgi:hypothetical protein
MAGKLMSGSRAGKVRELAGKGHTKEAILKLGMAEWGLNREQMLDCYRKAIKRVATPTPKTPNHTNTTKIGLSESELRSKHDNMFKIREGVKSLPSDRYLTDQQMRDFCKVSPSKWRGYADATEFDKYKLKVASDTTYWGVPQNIKRLRQDLNIL